jgi:hypothetical protein
MTKFAFALGSYALTLAITSPLIAAEPQPITLTTETGNPVPVFQSEDAIRFYGHMQSIGTPSAELFRLYSQSIACTARSGEPAFLIRNYGCLADPLIPSQSVCFSEIAITSGRSRGCKGVVANKNVVMPAVRMPMPAPSSNE